MIDFNECLKAYKNISYRLTVRHKKYINFTVKKCSSNQHIDLTVGVEYLDTQFAVVTTVTIREDRLILQTTKMPDFIVRNVAVTNISS